MAVNGHESRRSSTVIDRPEDESSRRPSSRPYPTRGTSSTNSHTHTRSTDSGLEHVEHSPSRELLDRPPKHVSFVHVLPHARQCARLPMRVMISPHDSTESIIATVKNFYGLYGPGVSFQDRDGNILIAAYDNFENDLTVYVKETLVEPKVEPDLVSGETTVEPSRASSEKPRLDAPFEMRPPPSHRLSLQTDNLDPNPRPRPQGIAGPDGEQNDATDSDGDASVTSSRRSKAEAHVSAEISVDNIVEGGRRKRAKFESFELPLFVPPQVSAGSISSISPQRRAPSGFDALASPLQYSSKKPSIYGNPMPSPRTFARFDGQFMPNGSAYANYGHLQPMQQPQYLGQYPQAQVSQQVPRGVGHMHYSARQPTGAVLPTPEPTVGSVISDEDVALQLMRLGDSVSHGRTSTSTAADDSFSRKADMSSDEEIDKYHKHGRHDFKKPRLSHAHGRRTSGGGRLSDTMADQSLVYSSDPEHDSHIVKHGEHKAGARKSSKSKHTHRASHGGSTATSSTDTSKPTKYKTKMPSGPMSPASIGAQSRRMSEASGVLMPGEEEEDDLSTKPRCQRCRKSKKGCDRVQPVCGRCKDAGVGPEGCIPEDEVNGRKGRYGRPMGASLKNKVNAQQVPGPDRGTVAGSGVHVPGEFLTPALPFEVVGDKSKKRKR